MPRPPDLTPAQIARWLAGWQAERDQLPPYLQRSPHAREAWLAGEWLGERLAELLLSPAQRHDVAFAYGQIAAHAPDPWRAAAAVLVETRAGRPPRPGPALSEQLLDEAGLLSNLAALFHSFAGRGITTADFAAMVDDFRPQPRYPPRLESGPHRHLFAELKAQKLPDAVIDRAIQAYRQFLAWRGGHPR